ncbi:MAG: hypothetical protein LBT55_05315 [Clostridiaceae bacterium]|jgi:hypothetical protein|nr:hypothetical protein [Clostridiaceae bacterium]
MKRTKAKVWSTTIIAIILASIMLFLLTGCNLPEESQTQKSILSNAEKKAVIDGNYGQEAKTGSDSYYGVGRTLNVITNEYVTVTSGYAKIFDADKLADLNWHRTYIGKMEASSASGNSMKSFMLDVSTEFKNTTGASVDLGIFKAGAERQFGFSASVSYENTANEIYFNSSQSYAANLIEIDEYYDLEQFQSVLSAKVLEDVERVQNDTMAASSFVSKYGTHAVLAGYYGGRIDCYYYLRNTDEKWDTDSELSYRNKIGTAIKDLGGANSETNFLIKTKIGADSTNAFGKFWATAMGGANFSALDEEAFLAHYNEWVTSMNTPDVEHSVIVGLPPRSLAAIWDLLPQEYAVAKKILGDYFRETAESSYSEFLSKYERHYTPPVEQVDTTPMEIVFHNSGDSQQINCNSDSYIAGPAKQIDIAKLNSWEKAGYAKVVVRITLQSYYGDDTPMHKIWIMGQKPIDGSLKQLYYVQSNWESVDGNITSTAWRTHDISASLKISDLLEYNNLILRYGKMSREWRRGGVTMLISVDPSSKL